ncbi:hypothetical protein U1Q18_014064, partial [Sarracenia purpurea var. burkii]
MRGRGHGETGGRATRKVIRNDGGELGFQQGENQGLGSDEKKLTGLVQGRLATLG